MIALMTKLPPPFAGLHRLVGPLFDKELRVAGRRRRNYALRFAYVVLLTVFIATIWVPEVRFGGSLVVQRTRMEMAAKQLTRGIVWFQFFAAQLVAVIMMSTAISDEVYGRTLGVLMITPLSSLQVVLGKLFSRLFQVFLLVATTLPLLAIVRVLGGVPWSYLVLSLYITLTTVLFVGSVGVFFSSFCRRAHTVVIVTTLGIVFLFAFLPFVSYILLGRVLYDEQLFLVFSYQNPYVLLLRCTEYMLSPRRTAVVPVSSLVSCGLFLVLGTGFLLASSVRLVRGVALRRAMGQPTFLEYLRRKGLEDDEVEHVPQKRGGRIRRVVGPPMIWKELVCVLSRRQKLAVALAVGIEIMLVFVAYTFPAIAAVIGYTQTHLLYIWVFLGLGVLFTLSASATIISAERESRAWPVLLVTPLTDRDILLGKFVGVLRRCGPVWLPLFAYIATFAYGGCFHPIAVVQVVLLITSAIVFLSATGFYFGSRCNRTAEAVTANLVLAGVIWCVLPMIGHWLAYGAYGRWDNGEFFAAGPFGQAFAMVISTLNGVEWYGWFGQRISPRGTTQLILVSMCGYALVAQVFIWRAVRAFRRHIV